MHSQQPSAPLQAGHAATRLHGRLTDTGNTHLDRPRTSKRNLPNQTGGLCGRWTMTCRTIMRRGIIRARATVLLFPQKLKSRPDAAIERHERLGGLLRQEHRKAA
jgi:hypothetical protein